MSNSGYNAARSTLKRCKVAKIRVFDLKFTARTSGMVPKKCDSDAEGTQMNLKQIHSQFTQLELLFYCQVI